MKLNVCACVFLWMNKMSMGENNNNNKWQQQQKVFCNDIVLKENDSEIR